MSDRYMASYNQVLRFKQYLFHYTIPLAALTPLQHLYALQRHQVRQAEKVALNLYTGVKRHFP